MLTSRSFGPRVLPKAQLERPRMLPLRARTTESQLELVVWWSDDAVLSVTNRKKLHGLSSPAIKARTLRTYG
jgi:hypothetical protein